MICWWSLLWIECSDSLQVVSGPHIQRIIAQKDSSSRILLVFKLFANTLNLVILIGSSWPIAILILVWCIGWQYFISLRWLWIAWACRPAILFTSDHLLDISKSYHLLIVQDVLKMCSTRQAHMRIIFLHMIWLLIIIKLLVLLLIFTSRCEKYLLQWVHCLTSSCHICLIITHRLGWKVMIIREVLFLSFVISRIKRGISVVGNFWIFLLTIWHNVRLILVGVSHWFMKVANQFIFLGFKIRLSFGLIRLLSLNYVLIFDLRFCLVSLMMRNPWIDGWLLLWAILGQSNQ